MMKRILTYILSTTALLCSCTPSLVTIDKYEFQYSEIVLINKSSEEVKVSIYGKNWVCPEDTVVLKPLCGLWKYSIDKDFIFDIDSLNVIYGYSSPIEYTLYADLPYNPVGFTGGCLYLNDELSRHQVIEFNDERRDAALKAIEDRKLFKMFTFGYPGKVLEEYTVPGSSDTYFASVFPVHALCDDLILGAAIQKEAGHVDKIQIIKDIQFNPRLVETESYEGGLEMVYGYNYYYYFEHLQKASLANFGCDFIALTGRTGDKLNRSAGMAATKVYLDSYECFYDSEAPEDILDKVDNHAIISRIEYGNIMILLVEFDEDPGFIMESLEYEVYHDYILGRTDIDYYLISLDENGQFTCIATGMDALSTYIDGFENPTIHPISLSFTDFSGKTALIHVNDIELD